MLGGWGCRLGNGAVLCASGVWRAGCDALVMSSHVPCLDCRAEMVRIEEHVEDAFTQTHF